MKRRNSIQIITPKMPKPATRWPLTRSADMPNISSALTITASITGPPTTSAMKIVRRDHSISPSERSNTRRDGAAERHALAATCAVIASPGT